MKKLIKNYLNKSFLINLLYIGFFAIISIIYFYPLLSGKQIKQSDIDPRGHSIEFKIRSNRSLADGV